MKRVAISVLALVALGATAPANGAAYSENPRLGASLSSVRHCVDGLAVYDVILRNDTRRVRTFRAVEVRRGVKLSDSHWAVRARTDMGLSFYIPSGRRSAVTVTYRGEVLMHRRLRGICY